MSSTDLLDDIDDVLTNWRGSRDAMRWTAPWDEPIVPDPTGWRILTDVEGMDGYAAQAYLGWLARRLFRQVAEHVNDAFRILAGQVKLMVEAFRQAAVVLEPMVRAMYNSGVREIQVADDDPFLRLIELKRRRGAPPGVDLATEKRRAR